MSRHVVQEEERAYVPQTFMLSTGDQLMGVIKTDGARFLVEYPIVVDWTVNKQNGEVDQMFYPFIYGGIDQIIEINPQHIVSKPSNVTRRMEEKFYSMTEVFSSMQEAEEQGRRVTAPPQLFSRRGSKR